jgi:hypothetical protein
MKTQIFKKIFSFTPPPISLKINALQANMIFMPISSEMKISIIFAIKSLALNETSA